MNALDPSPRRKPTPADHLRDDPRLRAVRVRLHAIAGAAGLAGRALEGGRVDFLPPELDRFAMQLDAVAARLVDVCERLSVGVDPQGARP
jgi:hypothetical protein